MTDTYTPKTDLSGKAKEVVRDVKAKAAGMTEDITQAAKDNAAQLSNSAREFASTAKDKAGEAMGQRKSLGADYIGSIAQATQQAAMAFDNDLPQAARYIRQASEQIQGAADNVREKDVRELVGDVQEFARHQPTLFFGGAVILGFAALRFLKSAPPKQPTSFDARREE
jgi:methyl-accepting chemotaxis protein